MSEKRKRIFANKLHKQIFWLFLLATLVPTALVTVCLYYLIFGITAIQVGLPETIAYHLIPAAQKVMLILAVAAPLTILAILLFANKITHNIVGPYDRIVRELGEILEGKKEGHITLRKTDKFWPLVEKINKLADKTKKG